MSTTSYPAPVDKLLTYGDCRKLPKWPDYLVLGFGPEHIPDLIRMATDSELNWGDPDSPEVWAPIHAWRALGQLHATEAVEPLLSMLDELRENHDDWSLEEYPEVFELIGPAAIPALQAYLADDSHLPISRICVADCLEHIGRTQPEARNECVAILGTQLERFAENDPGLNAFLIGYLMDFRAAEALPLMQRAFEAKCVDVMVVGDWEDVQIEFGLKVARDKPRQQPAVLDQIQEIAKSLTVLSAQSSESPASPQQRKSKAKKARQAPARQKAAWAKKEKEKQVRLMQFSDR